MMTILAVATALWTHAGLSLQRVLLGTLMRSYSPCMQCDHLKSVRSAVLIGCLLYKICVKEEKQNWPQGTTLPHISLLKLTQNKCPLIHDYR